MVEKNIGFVIGTGRCGTQSFNYILQEQKNCYSEHEEILCSWEFCDKNINDNLHLLYNKIVDSGFWNAYAVAFYFLPYVKYIIRLYPNSKILCLQRNEKDTIQSFIKKMRKKNFFVDYTKLSAFRRARLQTDMYYFCFPHFDKIDRIINTKLYYYLYYSIAKEFQKTYPKNFKIMWMNTAINNEEGQIKALKFLGISNPKFIPGIWAKA